MSKPNILIRPILESEFDAWRKVLALSEDGSPYQLPEYLQILARATANDVSLIGIFEGEQPVLIGGIGLFRCQSTFTSHTSSRLMLYYNGPFIAKHAGMSASREERRRLRLISALAKYLMKQNYDFVGFKVRNAGADYRALLDLGWTAKPVYSYLMRTDDLEEQWNAVDRNLKRLIRRGISDGLRFNEHGSFDNFYAMHLETHTRKQSPIYMPKRIFKEFITSLLESGIARLFEVQTADGITIASQLVLFSEHPCAHTLAASSRAEFQRTGCNPFLRWKTCEWLNAKGYQQLDLTDAHVLSVARFKSEMGAKLTLAMEYQSPIARVAKLRLAAQTGINRAQALASRLKHGAEPK